MTVKKSNKPSAFFERALDVMGIISRQSIDAREFTDARLAAIEDRLAMLDGGDNAKAARKSAVSDITIDRISAGRAPMAVRLVDDGEKIQWVKG